MIKLFKNLKAKYWLYIIIIIGLVTCQVLCDLAMPNRLINITTAASAIAGNLGMTVEQAKEIILSNGLQMLGLAFGSLVSVILTCFLAAKVAAGFAHDLRAKLYTRVQAFSMKEIDSFSTSSLITRTTNDITQVQMIIVMILRMAIAAPIYAIYGIIMALRIQGAAQLSYIVIASVVALVILVAGIFALVLPKFNRIQKLTDNLNLVTRESLTGIRVVRAANAIDIEEEKFKKANNDITTNNIFVNRVMSLFMPGMQLVLNFTSLAILWLGAYIIFENPLMLANVFGFQQYTMMIVMGFMQLTMIMIMVPRGVVCGRRISEVLDTEPSIRTPQTFETAKKLKGTIEFKDVSYSYGDSDEPVLQNITFKVNEGETLAIIGGTGSGKTTLINLIPRFIEATKGTILVDGVDVRKQSEIDLRNKIGYVPQKASLFSGTIRENLAFGKEDLTDEEIYDALEIAQSLEFVNKIGYDALVAQGGSNFSGGQKQRLSIARAVIKKPEILIFDDSFSALDLKTDKALREALKTKIHGTTNIIVAQRIGTILHADKIIVLDEGKIVGIGTHKDLLRENKVYQEIAYSQLSKEELENA